MSEILDDVAPEGRRLAVAAQEQGIPLRLLGGVAVWCICPSARVPPLQRAYGDADFVGHGGDRKRITDFMTNQGYEADRMFNALHGKTRLNFHDSARDRPIDVLLDKFTMAHELDLSKSRSKDGLTIAPADLLMTKLQVVSVNDKDVRDALALLVDHELADDDLSVDRVLAATTNDWGLEHTVHRSLATASDLAPGIGLSPGQLDDVQGRINALTDALNTAPKGRKWKLRARVGERVKWYEEPEEPRG